VRHSSAYNHCLTELILILVLILASGVFAGAEIALVALRKTRLQALVEDGRGGARAALALKEDPERFLATVQVGITVIGSTAAAFGGASLALQLTPLLSQFSWLGTHAHDVALALVVAGVSFFSIVLGELVPKSLALRCAERYALTVGKPLLALSWLARPFVWLLSSSANLVLRPFGDATTFTETRHSLDELQQIVEEATQAGTIHPEAGEIASRALELPELRVSDVMVPRQQVIMISRGTSPAELLPLLREHAHSRLPVYDERPDNVIGYVSVKDLLAPALEGATILLPAFLRAPYYVPDSKRAVELFKDMRERRVKFAIVVDELGGVAGIVTLEDLLEELVGDIFSEHSHDVPELYKAEATGAVIVSGAMPVREINRALGIELPEHDDWSTIAGLAMARAGRMPNVGEVLTLENGVCLEMVDVSPRRVRAVRIKRSASAPLA